MSICKKCNSTDVTETHELERNSYKNTSYNVLIDFSLCNSCGREFLAKNQILTNEIRVRDAKKEIDGLLSSTEIHSIRKTLGLTQTEASQVFGGGRNAFSKYERSEVAQSTAMDKLLRLASKDRFIFKKLIDLSDIKDKFNYSPLFSIDPRVTPLRPSKRSNWKNSEYKISIDINKIDKRILKAVA